MASKSVGLVIRVVVADADANDVGTMAATMAV